MKNTMINNCASAEMKKMFSEYLNVMDGSPRHTASAIKETVKFDAFLNGTFLNGESPMNSSLMDSLHERMMDCAVEFEESGFIAGMLFALSLPQSRVREIKKTLADNA